MPELSDDPMNAYKRVWRLRRWKKSAPVHKCKTCGSTWCRVPWHRVGRKPLYCSKKCKRRWEKIHG